MRLDDLPGDSCAFCGAGIEHKRVDAIYCSRDCKTRDRHRLDREAVEAEKRGRTCVVCEASIPPTRRGDTLFCSKACMDRVSYARCLGRRREAAREGRACVQCGDPIPVSLRVGTRFCGKACRVRAEVAKRRDHRARRRSVG